jgi:hypothetical protein
VSDFAQFLGFLQFFFGSMPELVFPTFGTSGPLPEFVSADSDTLLSWLWHDASSDVRSPVVAAFGGIKGGAAPGHVVYGPRNQFNLFRGVP